MKKVHEATAPGRQGFHNFSHMYNNGIERVVPTEEPQFCYETYFIIKDSTSLSSLLSTHRQRSS